MNTSRLSAVALPVAAAILLLVSPLASRGADTDGAKREEWVQKHEDLKAKHAKLRSGLEQARADYGRGRSTRKLRGEGKTGLVADIQRMQKELAESEQALSDFPEEARRAGALPGWFRDDGPPARAEAAPAAASRGRRMRSSSQAERPSQRERQGRRRPGRNEEPAVDGAQADDGGRRSTADRRSKDRDRRRRVGR
jgi:hypothetical protein